MMGYSVEIVKAKEYGNCHYGSHSIFVLYCRSLPSITSSPQQGQGYGKPGNPVPNDLSSTGCD